jgi:hypothetical protein
MAVPKNLTNETEAGQFSALKTLHRCESRPLSYMTWSEVIKLLKLYRLTVSDSLKRPFFAG